MNDTGIQSVVIMVCVSAVALIVGFILLGSMETANNPIVGMSRMNATTNILLTGFGQSAGLLALGLSVVAIMGIVGILWALGGRNE